MPQVHDSNGVIISGAFHAGDYGYGQLVAYTTAAAVANPFWTNKGTLTSDNTTPTDGDTVTIGTKVYTFKDILGATEGMVLTNGSADAALLNLIRAINHTGTPNTDYKCAAANADVTADAAVAAHAFQVYEKVGAASPGVALSAVSAGSTLTWSGANTSGGKKGEGLLAVMLSTAGYVTFAAAPVATTKKIPMAAGVPQIFSVPTGFKVSAVQAAAGGNCTAVEVA